LSALPVPDLVAALLESVILRESTVCR